MFFTAEHFVHPQKFEEIIDFENRLYSRFGLKSQDCYQHINLPAPFLDDHKACAHVLTVAAVILDECDEGRDASLDSQIETAADFLDELAVRV